MTRKTVNLIKKILKKENVKVCSTYFDEYVDESKSVLRVKVAEFLDYNKYYDTVIIPKTTKEKDKETQDAIIKVLMALSKNGLRPEYKTEQRTVNNFLGVYDCRYIIFK